MLEMVKGLVCVLSLFIGVLELLEKHRQALQLLSAETIKLVDVALKGASN